MDEEMPWWESRMLIEQLIEDRPWITYVMQVDQEDIERAESEQGMPVGSDLDSLAAAGFNVRQAGQ